MPYILTLVHNDDSGTITKQTISETITERPYACKNEYCFMGWTSDAAGTQHVSFPLTLIADITLYACYEKDTGACLRYTLSPDKTHVTVRQRGLVQGRVVVADLFLNKPVSEIEDRGFYWCTNMTHIRLPDSLRVIGSEAFARCVSIVTLDLPNKLEIMKPMAIDKCSSLICLSIPNSMKNMNGALSIEAGFTKLEINVDLYTRAIFQNGIICDSIKEIDLLPGKTTTGLTVSNDKNFVNAGMLETVTIPVGILNMERIFVNCRSLKNINLPEGLQTVNFAICGVEHVELPTSLTGFSGQAFDGCGIKKITFPPHLTNVDYTDLRFAFNMEEYSVHPDNPVFTSMDQCLCKKNDTGLTLYRYPEANKCTDYTPSLGITEIGAAVGENTRFLERVYFPEGIRRIGFHTFPNSLKNETLVFPKSLEKVDWGAFSESNYWVKSITFLRPASMGITTIDDYNFRSFCRLGAIYVPDQKSVEQYQNSAGIPNGFKRMIQPLE